LRSWVTRIFRNSSLPSAPPGWRVVVALPEMVDELAVTGVVTAGLPFPLPRGALVRSLAVLAWTIRRSILTALLAGQVAIGRSVRAP
jgi:hypothetical protein